MADNDLYRRHVSRPYRMASRAVYEHDDPDHGAQMALREASRELKASGCLGTNEMADVLLDAAAAGTADARARSEAVARLERIARANPGPWCEFVLRQAKARLCAGRPPSPLHRNFESLRIVAISLLDAALVDAVDARVSPESLVTFLGRGGRVSAGEFARRRQRFRDALRGQPGLRRLAEQAVADPSGGLIKEQRGRRAGPRRSQEALVKMAIA